MPPREWGFRIDDILEAIERIERYTADLDFAHWLTDEKPSMLLSVIWKLLERLLHIFLMR